MNLIAFLIDKDITGKEGLSHTKPRIAVNAILFDNEGRVALTHIQDWGLYSLVGGGVEAGESLLDALYREVLEETGCQCEVIKELGVIIENRFEQDITQERTCYLAKVVGTKGELNHTTKEQSLNMTLEWMPLDQALTLITSQQHDIYQRKFIQKRDIIMLNEAMNWMMLHDLPFYDTFKKITPIHEGWSSDKKYCVETIQGTKYFLRIIDTTRCETHKIGLKFIQTVQALDIPMCKLIAFDTCNQGMYALYTWVNGQNASDAIQLLSYQQQYDLGLKAGAILSRIHTIPAPTNHEDWASFYKRKTVKKIEQYKASGYRFKGDEGIIEYLESNTHLLENRPLCFQHGDYHIGNMMVEHGKLVVIDFDRFDFGDPWEEFNRIPFDLMKSPTFTTGMIRGYFNGEPPIQFWQLLKYYISCNTIASISWSIPYGQDEVEFMLKQAYTAFEWLRTIEDSQALVMV